MEDKIIFLEDALLIEDILVMSDLHIGNDDFLEESIFEKLEKLFEFLGRKKLKVRKIVVLGDLKDRFGEINDTEWRGVIRLIDFFMKKVDKENIIIIKGNHDSVLKPILDKRDIKLRDYYKYKNLVFIHGDKVSDKLKGSVIFIGHFHPTITLKDNYKSERYKCFLRGSYKRSLIYILPSFNPIYTGFNLNDLSFEDKNNFSDLKEKNLKNFDVIIYNLKERKALNFGKLKNIY